MPRAEVSPSLLRWARDRAGIPMEVPAERFTKLPEWEQGTSKPTLKKVEALSVPLDSEISDLARRFKVSTLVIIRRLRDAGFFSKAAFSDVFDAEMTRLLAREKGVVK